MATIKEYDAFELSIPLPRSLDTRIFIRLSELQKVVLVSLSTATQDELATSKPMGSFVYALPDVSATFATRSQP